MWRLLKLGVSLTEQGFDPVPAPLLDWLIAIDRVANEATSSEVSSEEPD